MIKNFNSERDWQQFHNPKDLASAIAIEASELQEHFLWKSQKESYEIGKNNEEVGEEFADIFNFMLIFADTCNIDIEKVVIDKIEKNKKKYPVEKAKGKNSKYNKL